MKLDGYDLKVLDKVEKITFTDYSIKKYSERNEGYIEHDKLMVAIEDLLCEIECLNQKIKDLENDDENDYPDEERDREREVLGI